MLSRLWRRFAGRYFGVEIIVSGPSMEPDFKDGDRAVLDPARYRRSSPARFDVVVLRPPGTGREDIKRIVGLPGELVEIRDGRLMIDGAPVDEPHLAGPMPRDWLYAWQAREGQYVVLSDNRTLPGTADSRRYGPIKGDAIAGPVTRLR